MESGILKTILFILGVFAALFASFMLGVVLTNTNAETKKPEILGKLEFSTRFYCQPMKAEVSRLRDRVYPMQQECELINNPRVRFIVGVNCQRERGGLLCMGNVRPFEEKELD